MHFANLKKSDRLQRFMAFMGFGEWKTTREIQRGAGICAVSATVSEIRANGHDVDCLYSHMTRNGSKVYKYRVHKAKR
jgi:hypothetical protein